MAERLPETFAEGKPRDPEHFQALEAIDDQTIVSGLDGFIPASQMFYVLQQGGATIIGISLDGVREIVRQYAEKQGLVFRLSDHLDVTETDDAYLIRCKAEVDYPSGGHIENWGVKRQEKNMTLRVGNTKPDQFAFEKGCSKAQRNAFMGIIPKGFIEMAYSDWLKSQGGRGYQAPPQRQQAPRYPGPESRPEPVREEPKREPPMIVEAVEVEFEPPKPYPDDATQEELGIEPVDVTPPTDATRKRVFAAMGKLKPELAKHGITDESFKQYIRALTGVASFNDMTAQQQSELAESLNNVRDVSALVERIKYAAGDPDIWTHDTHGARWLTERGVRFFTDEPTAEKCEELVRSFEENRPHQGYLIVCNGRVHDLLGSDLTAVAITKRPRDDQKTTLALASLMTCGAVWKMQATQAMFVGAAKG